MEHLMKLRTLSESLGAIWVALSDAMEPHQRATASRVLADALEDGAITDPLARCLIEAIAEDCHEWQPAPPIAPWHQIALNA
jgi:hypothetical protein